MRQERGWAIRACVLMRVGGSVLTEALARLLRWPRRRAGLEL